MSCNTDDGSVSDDSGLLRRIRPDQVIDDKNRGVRRPSSAAFKDPRLSVDAEPILHEDRLDWTFSLEGYDGYSLARFIARVAREKQLAVIHKPLDHNRAHVEVVGKKTQSIANYLRDNSQWVHLV